MDQIIPEKFDRSKARVIFFGKEIAEEGIFSTLDSVYRDLRGALYAKVAIFEGEAKDALSVNSGQSILISDLYAQLLDSAEKSGITKNENVQEICPIILSEGQDIVLPYIGLKEGSEEPVIKGLALFTDDKMTGSLNIDETTVLLILMDKITKDLSLNIKFSDEHKDPNKNFIDIAMRKVKRKLKLESANGRIKANIEVKAQVEIDEYAADNLSHSKKVNELSEAFIENV